MDENVVFDPASQDQKNQEAANVSPRSGSVVNQPGNLNPVESPEVLQTVVGGENPPDAPPPKTGGGILKKIIISLIILAVLIFSILLFLPKDNAKKEAKLVWWGLWEDQAVVEPLIADFQKDHPNITVEYIKQDPKQYREKLTTRIKNGTGPDLFRYHNTWIPMLSDALLPFSSDVISPEEFKKSYYPVVQKDLVQNGGIYGIPLGADSLALFVNTDILSKAGTQVPQNWEDFVKVARELTVKDSNTKKIKTSGAAMGTYGNITHASDVISLLFFQQGIDTKDFLKAAKDDKVDVLNFYTSFAKGNDNVWDSTLDESILAFARGNLAMYFGFSWDVIRIQAINKDLPFEVHPVPQLFGRNAGIASYWVEGVSVKSPNQKAALQFMQYLSRKETAQKFYTTASKTRPFGEPYARADLGESLKENKLVYPFVTQLESAASSYFASDTYDGEGGINFLSNNYLGNAIDSIVNDNSSPQSAVETLNKGVGQVYKKYGIR